MTSQYKRFLKLLMTGTTPMLTRKTLEDS